MKILIVGDVHFRVNSPISRVDDISEVFIEKFKQIAYICEKHHIDNVVITGDIFDKARPTIETMLLAEKCIKMLPEVWTIVGNHDMIGNTMANFEITGLNVLKKLCNNLHFLSDRPELSIENLVGLNYGNNNFNVEYYKDMILVCHSMITDGTSMFESIDANNIETTAKFIIAGHNHNIICTDKVYNPGALIRLTSAKDDRERQVEVGILDTNDLKLKRIRLAIKPMEEVFDISVVKQKEKIISQELIESLQKSIENVKTAAELLSEAAKEASQEAREKINLYFNGGI